jgi:hypothetical protein
MVIDRRRRNRALLARQMLLDRSSVRPLAALTRLIGMQAQTPRSPYTALWSRLDGFDPMTLSRAIAARKAVRIAVMRSTIHLVTAADALRLRPLMQPVLMRELAAPRWRDALDGVDLSALAVRARELLDTQPRTPAQLGAALAPSWPANEPQALAHAARTLLPLVQLPPRGLWDGAGATTVATAEHWLGRLLDVEASWDDVALRYLAAFGPASAADLVAWSRVTGLTEVFQRLRPQLIVHHDPDGRELFDVPRAALPRPPRRRRPGSCRTTTTCCSPTPTATTSLMTAAAGPPSRSTACCREPSSWTVSWPPPGHSTAAATSAVCSSPPSSRSHANRPPRCGLRVAGCSVCSPPTPRRPRSFSDSCGRSGLRWFALSKK